MGIDIGGTKCAVVVGNEHARIIDEVRFPTDAQRGPDRIIDEVIEAASRLIEKSAEGGTVVRAVGISCGGPLDSRRGMILSPPNLPGWDEVPLVETVQRRLSLPANLLNDADACAVAEHRFGAGRGCTNMIFLTFGTGLGAGLILGGRLYRGSSDTAGEVGHIRLSEQGPVGYGKSGSFEGYCSGGGIARIAQDLARKRLTEGQTVGFCSTEAEISSITAKSVAEAAEAGDSDAQRIYRRTGEWLGRGLAVLVDILNPERIILGGVYGHSRKLMESYAVEAMKREALDRSVDACTILPAGLGDRIGDVAALCAAVEEDRERADQSVTC